MLIEQAMPDDAWAHDAAHRGKYKGTHPTHACSEELRGFAAMPLASPVRIRAGNGAIPRVAAMAIRIAAGGGR